MRRQRAVEHCGPVYMRFPVMVRSVRKWGKALALFHWMLPGVRGLEDIGEREVGHPANAAPGRKSSPTRRGRLGGSRFRKVGQWELVA
jgi:hypothetical protein